MFSPLKTDFAPQSEFEFHRFKMFQQYIKFHPKEMRTFVRWVRHLPLSYAPLSLKGQGHSNWQQHMI